MPYWLSFTMWIWGRCCWQSNLMQHVNTHGTIQASTTRSTAHHNNTFIAANLTIIESVIRPHMPKSEKKHWNTMPFYLKYCKFWNHSRLSGSCNSFSFSVNKRWQSQHQSARLAHIVPKELRPSAWTLKTNEIQGQTTMLILIISVILYPRCWL